jgi:plastocyanin
VPRRLTLLAVALLVASAVTACSSSDDSSAACAKALRAIAPVSDFGSEHATGSTIEVDGGAAGFTPTCITDVPRGTVTLTMHNTGEVVHDIGVAAQHVEADAPPGGSVSIRVRVDAEPVELECRIHRHLGMAGVLIPAG